MLSSGHYVNLQLSSACPALVCLEVIRHMFSLCDVHQSVSHGTDGGFTVLLQLGMLVYLVSECRRKAVASTTPKSVTVYRIVANRFVQIMHCSDLHMFLLNGISISCLPINYLCRFEKKTLFKIYISHLLVGGIY